MSGNSSVVGYSYMHCRWFIVPVFYGYETWSATFRGEQKLIVFENRVLRVMFGTERGSNRRLAKTT
jgi:hypothetical protein